MTTVQASLQAFALAFAGMAALAFAMDRHHEQLAGEMEVPVKRRRGLRFAGALLLAAAAVPCIQVWSVSAGGVVWLGWLSMGAITAVALISMAPPWAARAACGLAAAGIAGLISLGVS